MVFKNVPRRCTKYIPNTEGIVIRTWGGLFPQGIPPTPTNHPSGIKKRTLYAVKARKSDIVPTSCLQEKEEHLDHFTTRPHRHPLYTMSLDHRIKCNYLTCRKELIDRALVTTCSHIYCIECAGLLRLVSQPFGSCPACEGSVPAGTSPQATSIVHLNPSDEFKSTVLSGLSPNDIIECAGRALSFWGYQTTQEIHPVVRPSLTSDDQRLSEVCRKDFERDLQAARERVEKFFHFHDFSLTRSLAELNLECGTMRQKNEDLGRAYKEKSRKLLQTQELYDRAKREAELRQIQAAAAACGDAGPHHHASAFQGTRAGLVPGPGPGLFEQQAQQAHQAHQTHQTRQTHHTHHTHQPQPHRLDENTLRGLDTTNHRLAHAHGLSPRYSINAAYVTPRHVAGRFENSTGNTEWQCVEHRPAPQTGRYMDQVGCIIPTMLQRPLVQLRLDPDMGSSPRLVPQVSGGIRNLGRADDRVLMFEIAMPHINSERPVLPTATFVIEMCNVLCSTAPGGTWQYRNKRIVQSDEKAGMKKHLEWLA
ncbi:hypothetical protein ACRALDRAFT_209918 [Sodiomyces alcalophilus JCM 7366]|uniref:uncharacterized protein n=1 Tax=Sodiomyces alcalophilus JCM 7366 TaxID=591952 RepID=UPI0039B5BDCB